MTIITEQTATVASPSQDANKMAESLAMVRALMGGTASMRKSGMAYLKKWPDEGPDAYASRLAVSTLFPAYSRTVTTLAGKPFSKPLTYGDDVPSSLKAWMQEDADLQGRNLDTLAACVLESALAHGHCGILVDMPHVEAGEVLTQAQEKDAGVRPYFNHIEPWNILGWRSERFNGVQRLTLLRLMEYVTVPDGEFGDKSVQQVRVLTPGAWATHRKDDNGDWVQFESGTTSIQAIPFVVVYSHRTDFMVSKPPMLEMAHLNVKHWQSQSDQDNILHVARVPILVVVGVDDDNFSMSVGGSHSAKLPMGAQAMYVEHSGAGIGAGKVSLDDLKEEMRQAGAELLVLTPGGITATQIGSENAIGMCALQRIVAGVEDAIDQALQFAADYANLGEGGHVTIYNDFGAAPLSDLSAQLLLTAATAGKLSNETMLAEFKRRGILSPEVDLAAEQARIDTDGPPLGAAGVAGAGGDPLAGDAGQGDAGNAGNAPVVPPVEPVEPPEPVDLTPVLDALATMQTQVDSLVKSEAAEADEKPEPAEPVVDLAPLTAAVAAIAAQVTALMDEPADKEEQAAQAAQTTQIVADALKPIQAQLAAWAAKPEPEQVDQAALMASLKESFAQDIALAVASLRQPQQIVMMDQSGVITKRIELLRDASGQLSGATSTQG